MKLMVAALGGTLLIGSTGWAAETIEALGAERCGGPVPTFSVDFLSPEEGQVVATARVKAEGLARPARETASLSLNGEACEGGECSFRARKGQTYALAATRAPASTGDLCISVARP